VAAIYQAADVYLGASMAEGFGLPIIEAQACGVPVVVTDYASMPELVEWGAVLPPLDLYWAAGLETWWAWPDWHAIGEGLQEVYEETRERRDLDEWADCVSENIHRLYGWDAVVEQYWRPLVEEWAA